MNRLLWITVLTVIMGGVGMASAQEAATDVVAEDQAATTVTAEIASAEELAPAPTPTPTPVKQTMASAPEENAIPKGREEEEGPVSNIFQEGSLALKRLRLESRFAYDPEGLRNPMVIPWLRMSVIATERTEKAIELIAQGGPEDLEQAQEILEQVIVTLPQGAMELDPAQKALSDAINKLAALDKEKSKTQQVSQAKAEEQRMLPDEVRRDVQGILWSQTPQILFRNERLKVGDAVPGFAEVIVERIEKKQVVFAYADRMHIVDFGFTADDLKDDLQIKDAPLK